MRYQDDDIKAISAKVDEIGSTVKNIAFRLATRATLRSVAQRVREKRMNNQVDAEYIGLLMVTMYRTFIDARAALKAMKPSEAIADIRQEV